MKDKDWANVEYGMSNFRGSTEIVVRNPNFFPSALVNTAFNKTITDTLKLGFMGLGEEQQAHFKVEMMQTAWRIGDNVSLRVTIDNRACEKPLEPIQIKFSMRGNL